MNDEYISKQKVLDYLNSYLQSLCEGGADDSLFDRGQRRALINSIQDISAIKAADIAELKEAKRLLKVAVNDIQDMLHYANSISVCFHCVHRIDTCYRHPACKDRAKWEHLEEALKLIGEDKEEEYV